MITNPDNILENWQTFMNILWRWIVQRKKLFFMYFVIFCFACQIHIVSLIIFFASSDILTIVQYLYKLKLCFRTTSVYILNSIKKYLPYVSLNGYWQSLSGLWIDKWLENRLGLFCCLKCIETFVLNQFLTLWNENPNRNRIWNVNKFF